MTVKAVRKEMDMSGQVPQNAPANNSQFPPQQQQQPQSEIPDHTHPEYDQMMVKLQEIEGQLQGQAPGGINQESLDEGKPEDDAGKPKGSQQPISDNQGNDEPNKIESYIRKIVKEELTGIPERDIGKQLDGAGPDNTDNVPQTQQPAVGDAPSGGDFDSDDKTNKEDGDKTVAKMPGPASEFEKIPIQKNKLNQAKALIEKAKALMKEANGEDPSQPNPGAEEKDPKKMDGSVPNKSPVGGTEGLDNDADDVDGDSDPLKEEIAGASEDPEANIPNDKRPDMKENIVDKVFSNLKKEVTQEGKSQRESFVGLTAASNDSGDAMQEEFLDTKEKVTKTMKEYLSKAGHSRALGFMVPPQVY